MYFTPDAFISAMTTSQRTDTFLECLDSEAAPGVSEFFSTFYEDLRCLAQRQIARQPRSHSLQATALAHEVFVRMAGAGSNLTDEKHFLRLGARIMRQVLTDHARRKAAFKRSPLDCPDPVQELVDEYDRRSGGLLVLDEALERLAKYDAQLVRLVELRFIAGFSMEEVAAALGLPERTARRRWAAARLILQREMGA